MNFSPRLSIVRKMSAALCLGLATVALSISQAIATPYVFTPFNVTVTNDPVLSFPNDVGEFVLTPTPVGEIYTTYSVTLDWSSISGEPWSEEALIYFVDSFSTLNEIYLDSTPATNGQSSEAPITLQFSGFLDTPYVGGDPLSFLYYQSFSGSSALWENVTITLDSPTITPPPSIGLTVPDPLAPTFSTSGPLATGEVAWFNFTYLGGEIQFDTLGSILSDTGGGANDTELGIFNALGGFIGSNDDIDFPDILESGFIIDETVLTVGETYYLALGGFNTTFTNGFGATSNATAVGTYQLNVTNITAVPEGNTVGLLASGGLFAIGMTIVKRRKSA